MGKEQKEKKAEYFVGHILSGRNDLQKLVKQNPALYEAVGLKVKAMYDDHLNAFKEYKNTLEGRTETKDVNLQKDVVNLAIIQADKIQASDDKLDCYKVKWKR